MNLIQEMDDRNPDPDFVLHGKKESLRSKGDNYMSNSQKTISTKNLETLSVKHTSGNGFKLTSTPTIYELERSVNDLKLELQNLNLSLQENYKKSDIFLGHDENIPEMQTKISQEDEDLELEYLLKRSDPESVSHAPDKDASWYKDPKHKTKLLGDYPTYQEMGVTRRSVSPVNRSVGRFGSEIATKDVTGLLKPSDLASNEQTFPVRLTAPHIVGVKSLLPPKYAVREQNKERAKSPQSRYRSMDPELLMSESLKKLLRSDKKRSNSQSPLPVWMPTSKDPNASGKSPPVFGRQRKSASQNRRPSSAPGGRRKRNIQLSQSLPLHSKPFTPSKYKRPVVQSQPSNTVLSFLRSADQIDTRRALVENSPYQQELARLRLERLRVEEDYLLQLKRESELERIRGPKPKWYELKSSEFYYECNKNTAVHKNVDQWGETMQYRDQLLEASREFSENMRAPVPPLD